MSTLQLLRTWRDFMSLSPKDQSNLLERFTILRRIASHVLPEYRFKWPQMDWWQDEQFTNYLKKFNENEGNNTDRRFTVSQLLRMITNVEGDTAEIGVYEGAMSWLICRSISGSERTHHIFDSFEGLSPPLSVDGAHWTVGSLACGLDIVTANLSEFHGGFKTYKGWVPTRFNEVEHLHFAFVHVDVDLFQPTKDTLEFFYPRMNIGGILICDDYGFTSCPGATKACNDFLADKPEKMLGLSAGGGFFIKGIKVD